MRKQENQLISEEKDNRLKFLSEIKAAQASKRMNIDNDCYYAMINREIEIKRQYKI